MEKFFNIKCRMSGLVPDAVVIVSSVRTVNQNVVDIMLSLLTIDWFLINLKYNPIQTILKVVIYPNPYLLLI